MITYEKLSQATGILPKTSGSPASEGREANSKKNISSESDKDH